MNRAEYDKLLAEYGAEIENAFIKAIESLKSQVVLQDVIKALEANNIDDAIDALKVEPQAFYVYEKAIEGTLFSYGSIVIATIKSPLGRQLQTYFNMKNARAERFLADKSSDLITYVLEPTKQAARAVLQDGMANGLNPRNIALDIVGRIDPITKKREGGILGLTPPQAEYVINAKNELQNLDANYFQRKSRDKRFDKKIQKAIDSGKSLTQDDIIKITNRYEQRLLKYRGNVIGRTEALSAMNYAEYESFKQGLESTNYSDNQVIGTWDSAGDLKVRHSHAVLDKKQVRGLEGVFTTINGAKMRFPMDRAYNAPASEVIQCRCRLVRKIDYFNEVTNV